MADQGLIYLYNLNSFLKSIDNNLYTLKLDKFPFTGNIGAHCRHIIEFYTQFLNFYKTKTLDYDGRQRDLLIESDIDTAKSKILTVIEVLENQDFNSNTVLSLLNNGQLSSTTIGRELNYLAEHNVHHMAIIRILAETIPFDFSEIAQFGIAVSTKGHRISES